MSRSTLSNSKFGNSSDTGFTTRYIFPLVKDKASNILILNAGVIWSAYLCTYLFQFSSPSCTCSESILRILFAYFMIVNSLTTLTCVLNYSWNNCPLSPIHRRCWDSDPALMERRAIFSASTYTSKSFLTTSSHLFTCTSLQFQNLISHLTSSLLHFTVYRCIYHYFFLTILHTFNLFCKHYCTLKLVSTAVTLHHSYILISIIQCSFLL